MNEPRGYTTPDDPDMPALCVCGHNEYEHGPDQACWNIFCGCRYWQDENAEGPERDTYPDDANDGRSMPKRDENNPGGTPR